MQKLLDSLLLKRLSSLRCDALLLLKIHIRLPTVISLLTLLIRLFEKLMMLANCTIHTNNYLSKDSVEEGRYCP
jgi:hypothetical protein